MFLHIYILPWKKNDDFHYIFGYHDGNVNESGGRTSANEKKDNFCFFFENENEM
jgi:hypothetical protein